MSSPLIGFWLLRGLYGLCVRTAGKEITMRRPERRVCATCWLWRTARQISSANLWEQTEFMCLTITPHYSSTWTHTKMLNNTEISRGTYISLGLFHPFPQLSVINTNHYVRISEICIDPLQLNKQFCGCFQLYLNCARRCFTHKSVHNKISTVNDSVQTNSPQTSIWVYKQWFICCSCYYAIVYRYVPAFV